MVPLAEFAEQLPGRWRFVYHTNEYGYRAQLLRASPKILSAR